MLFSVVQSRQAFTDWPGRPITEQQSLPNRQKIPMARNTQELRNQAAYGGLGERCGGFYTHLNASDEEEKVESKTTHSS